MKRLLEIAKVFFRLKGKEIKEFFNYNFSFKIKIELQNIIKQEHI